MSERLKQFLEQLPQLSAEERILIAENLNTRELSKGTTLLEAGQVPGECYFVLEGCIRQYHVDQEGNEQTTAIYAEDEGAVSSSDYINKTPSKSNLICIEDSLLIVGDPEKDQEMYAKFPILAEVTRAMVEQDLGRTKEAFAEFVTSSPEERYLGLLNNRPHLFNRVPLYQLASLIGMKPESLSRIRKRTVTKD